VSEILREEKREKVRERGTLQDFEWRGFGSILIGALCNECTSKKVFQIVELSSFGDSVSLTLKEFTNPEDIS
jgi:hypothetical protein